MLTSRRWFYFVAAAALLALLHGPAAHAAKGIYRGVATNAWAGGCEDIKALSRMSWYYGWALEVLYATLPPRERSKPQPNRRPYANISSR